MQEKDYENESNITPAVSVIVPIYNVEKYLAECVDSILGQTFQDMEIILVDDGSLDSSSQMADDYAVQDQRVKVIHKENGGLSSARNAGMKIARGEYIYFCDSDDYISLDAIEILYETVTKNDLDMVLFNGDSFLGKEDIDNKLLAQKVAWANRDLNRKGLYGGGCNAISGIKMFCEMSSNEEYLPSACLQFIRRTFCIEKNLRFYEGIFYEDALYTMKALLSAERVMFVAKRLFHYRRREGSIMISPEGEKHCYSYFIVYYEIIMFLSVNKWPEAVVLGAVKKVSVYKNSFLRIWQKLNEKEKTVIQNWMSLLQRVLLNEIVRSENLYQELSKSRKQLMQVEIKNQKLSKELWDIRQGYSFRIGRIVTWLPRKLRGGIKCFRQHGMVYTAKRTLEHMGINMGTKDFARRK